MGCGARDRNEMSPQVQLDLSAVDADGLIGSATGLRALSYEFCIPNEPALIDEVRSIDANVEIQAGAPGRIGCSDAESLCISHTSQPGYRSVLARLSDLEYVDRIVEAHFE